MYSFLTLFCLLFFNLMMDNEIGVSSQFIKLPKLDMDYFE